MLTVTLDTSSVPTIQWDIIPFFIVEKGESNKVCKAKPGAYVIDTQSD